MSKAGISDIFTSPPESPSPYEVSKERGRIFLLRGASPLSNTPLIYT
jgi:hypothetical protein